MTIVSACTLMNGLDCFTYENTSDQILFLLILTNAFTQNRYKIK